MVVGSTNCTVFLHDVTGSRRYWVIEAEHVDLEWLRACRNQLLAEAVHLYRDGEQWWLPSRYDEQHEQRNRKYLASNAYCAAAGALLALVPDYAVVTVEQVGTVLGVTLREHRDIIRGFEAAGWHRVRSATTRGLSPEKRPSVEVTWKERMAAGQLALPKLGRVWSDMFHVTQSVVEDS